MLRPIAALCLLLACQDPAGREVPMLLPKELREVSGIAALAVDRLLAVQDEAGVLFEVSLPTGVVTARRPFGADGDYEGLAVVGDRPWVLRSDGRLHELRADGERFVVTHAVQMPAAHDDWEGLCHDAVGKRLLVMPKARGDGKKARERLPIFAVDLAVEPIAPPPAPWLVLSAKALRQACKEQGLPDAKDFELLPSELAVLPKSRELLVLFGSDRLLLRLDFQGKLLAGAVLDKRVLPQPEGLAWLPDGRLLVASEGDGGPARLVAVAVP